MLLCNYAIDCLYLIEIKTENSSNIFLITVDEICILKTDHLSNLLLRRLYCVVA